MDTGIIRTWLQLPSGDWPPDHYTLLGLKPGEEDAARIEQQVHERMEKVRHYQLIHPEPATEAMNRLAQALVCLTDSKAKRAYDTEHFPSLVYASDQPPPPVRHPALVTDPFGWLFGSQEPHSQLSSPVQSPSALDWQSAPPPLRQPAALATPEQVAQEAVPMVDEMSRPDMQAGSFEASSEGDALAVAERHYLENARRHAGTMPGRRTARALYFRARRIRQLQSAWLQAGKYVNQPRRMVTRPGEATDLIRQMHMLRDLVQGAPTLLGEAGQPGYQVLTLARQEMIVPILQTLLPSQRDALARDWQAGYAQLMAHRSVLREELHVRRHRGGLTRAVVMFATSFRDHPELVLFVIALVTLNLTFRELRALWLRQLLAILVVLGLKLGWWWLTFRPTKFSKATSVGPRERRPAAGSRLGAPSASTRV